MQFILKKNTPPPDWDDWFRDGKGERSFTYRTPPIAAKQHLINEQNGLCAYCQKEISANTSTIEHVIPNSLNEYFSTSYHNLVAVCTTREYCEKVRGNLLLPPIIFYSDLSCPDGANFNYFIAEEDGSISILSHGKDINWNLWMQLRAFIDILNLNNDNLVLKRQEILTRWRLSISGKPYSQQKAFWKAEFDVILNKPGQPFRQFLLIYLKKKMDR